MMARGCGGCGRPSLGRFDCLLATPGGVYSNRLERAMLVDTMVGSRLLARAGRWRLRLSFGVDQQGWWVEGGGSWLDVQYRML